MASKKIEFYRLRKFVIVIMIMFTFLNSNIFTATGNPIRIDDYREYTDINYEGFPLISRNSSSVYFKQEIINVTFDSSDAHFQADYIFKNNDSTQVNISIILPFAKFFNYSKKPKNIILSQDQEILSYFWCEFPYNSTDSLSSVIFNAIMFNLTFNANEEVTVHIEYTRNYLISRKYGCEYRYLVGTARSWNHSIESATFEFRIPKQICNQIFSSIHRSSEIYSHEIRETSYFYIVNIYFQNWTPNTDLSSVGVHWERDFPPDISGILFLAIGLLAIGFLSFTLISAKKCIR